MVPTADEDEAMLEEQSRAVASIRVETTVEKTRRRGNFYF